MSAKRGFSSEGNDKGIGDDKGCNPDQTSWTDLNPGRRYWACSGMKGRKGCGFVRWFDLDMCERSMMIIPGLLRKLNRKEEEIKNLKSRQKFTIAVLVAAISVGFWMMHALLPAPKGLMLK